MNRKNKNISEEDFRRYLEDRMNDTERNRFERELQKNPFEAEALEGFRHISATKMKKDLQELNEKIVSKKHKNTYRYRAAAASVLLIISAGIIWFQVNEKSLIPEMAETKIQQESIREESLEFEQSEPEQPAGTADTNLQQETTEQADLTEKTAKKAPVKKDVKTDSAPENVIVLKSRPKQEESSAVTELVTDEQDQGEISTEKIISMTAQEKAEESIAHSIPDIQLNQHIHSFLPSEPSILKRAQTMRGKIVSSKDSMPLPGAAIWQKGTQNAAISDMEGNFKLKLTEDSNHSVVANFAGMEPTEIQPSGDSFQIIALKPEEAALDEAVVIGYGSQKKQMATGSVSSVQTPEDIEARPETGIKAFKNYLEKEAVLPADYPKKRKAVKLLLKINAEGKITKILNQNNSDSLLFDRAKQIIRNGPNWLPEVRDGKRTASETELKMVFKK